MFLRIPQILTPDEVLKIRRIIEPADWKPGGMTAGSQSEKVKNNLQLPEDSPAAVEARSVIVKALGHSALFVSAALPRKTFPPLFNRYEGSANCFGNHIDNAIRTSITTKAWVRTDISLTLFLSNPEDYEGGELVIDNASLGIQKIKLPAGDVILYPSTSVHRVEPVTGGSRLASFFWIESMVRDNEHRKLLFDMDMAIMTLRESQGDNPAIVQLTGCYHNLLRQWADS